MSLLRYFLLKSKQERKDVFPWSPLLNLLKNVPSLSDRELQATNASVQQILATEATHEKYNRYNPQQRAVISKHAAENGPTRAARHFSDKSMMNILEPTAKKFKEEYLKKLNELILEQPCSGDNSISKPVEVKAKPQGRPLLLGEESDKCVQDYIKNLREIGEVVNTAIVIGATNGIVGS